MPRIIEKTLYQFAELSDEAKEKAREWYRSTADSNDLDSVIEDFARIAGVFYRGKRLKYWMENESENVLFQRAKTWAFANGFSHIKVTD